MNTLTTTARRRRRVTCSTCAPGAVCISGHDPSASDTQMRPGRGKTRDSRDQGGGKPWRSGAWTPWGSFVFGAE